MDKFPFTSYADGEELVFTPKKGFVPMTMADYLNFNGTTYQTIWSIGCPYKCSFCGNTKFIENDKNYRKLRHPSVEYMLMEVKTALKKHPYLSTVMFNDDSFMAIPKATLIEFSNQWKKEINIPFAVLGVIPSFVRDDKLKILINGGMNRLRMGIQSGSDRILKFYDRPNKEGLVPKAHSMIAAYSKYMIPPAYDIIVGNPIETRQDVIDTLELLYNMERPFTIDIFALKIIPNTVMERDFLKHGISLEEITSNYSYIEPTFANALLFLLTVIKPPRWLFVYWLNFVKPHSEKQKLYLVFYYTSRFLWLAKRAFNHFRFMDFSTFPGRIGWVFWKLGLVKFWRKLITVEVQ